MADEHGMPAPHGSVPQVKRPHRTTNFPVSPPLPGSAPTGLCLHRRPIPSAFLRNQTSPLPQSYSDSGQPTTPPSPARPASLRVPDPQRVRRAAGWRGVRCPAHPDCGVRVPRLAPAGPARQSARGEPGQPRARERAGVAGRRGEPRKPDGGGRPIEPRSAGVSPRSSETWG